MTRCQNQYLDRIILFDSLMDRRDGFTFLDDNFGLYPCARSHFFSQALRIQHLDLRRGVRPSHREWQLRLAA